jgi:multisubunit Na+/H+ antiporter MnhB subunit
MNKSGKYEKDILADYINRERIEKAPEGFTEKIMTRIQVESTPERVKEKFRLNILVPLVSGIITVALVISAILFASPEKETTFSSVVKLLQNLQINIPEFRFGSFTGFNLPGWLIYLAVGLFVLTLFDRALYNLFHREGK